MRMHEFINENAQLDIDGYPQQTDYSCGDAAIRSIIKYFGLDVPSEKQIIKVAGTSKKFGTLPGQMVDALKKYNIHAVTKTSNVNELMEIIKEKTPAALLLTYQKEAHWMLLVAVADNSIKLFDPYRNKNIFLTKEELKNMWRAKTNGEEHFQTVVVAKVILD